MKIYQIIAENRKRLVEGGNLTIDGKQAEHLDLKVTNRSYIVPVLNNLLYSINDLYQKEYKKPLWNPKLLQSQAFLSGSSLHFFNVKGISDEEFVSKKPKVGDIDTMVNRDDKDNLVQFLHDLTGKKMGDAVLVGFHTAGNEQYSGLWEIGVPPAFRVQIDFELVEFNQDNPTDWAKFSHSSSWEDLQLRIKGVFHKWLIQSLASLTFRDFLQRKLVGRGNARAEQDVPTRDTMMSFAVASKEGGGLRAKYLPVIDPDTNKPVVKDGLPVMTAAPTSGYEQNIQQIFSKLFGKTIDEKTIDRGWSFNGILDIMNLLLNPAQKEQVFNQFLQKTIGSGAQGMYKNDPDRDIAEKTVAINHAMKKLGLPKPSNLDQMFADYREKYRMTPIAESAPDYKRRGIPHIFNPGSSTEMKDAEFIKLCQEIADNGGSLDDASINLKVDGNGVRFGKDAQGRPFFMTGKDSEPAYAENYGYYARKMGDETNPAYTKYDEAMKVILSSDFIKTIPNDTIVQAEVMYAPAGKKSKEGTAFVKIPYDPRKLGSILTVVPFDVKTYSTGQQSPNSDKIRTNLLGKSTKEIKMVDNHLPHSNLNVSNIVDPVANNADTLLTAIKSRDPAQKEKAKIMLGQARKKLSDVIISSPNIKNKDQLGKIIEGLVITLPNGMQVKVTSSEMKDKMAKKAPPRTGPDRTAVVAIGSFAGHKGHEQLWELTKQKAVQVGGDAYMFIGNKVGPDDPIPPDVKLQTWKKLYPEDSNAFSTVREGGTIPIKIRVELINTVPDQPPKYDNIIIMVGEDQATSMKSMADSIMKFVNRFPGYEHVKVSVEPTARGTGINFTALRNVLKDPNMSEQDKLKAWAKAFDVKKLGVDWIKQLMNISSEGINKNNKDTSTMKSNDNTQLESIRRLIATIKPMISEATPAQKQKFVNLLSEAKQRLDPKCWKGKHKEGTKMKGGIRVNNCVPNESVSEDLESRTSNNPQGIPESTRKPTHKNRRDMTIVRDLGDNYYLSRDEQEDDDKSYVDYAVWTKVPDADEMYTLVNFVNVGRQGSLQDAVQQVIAADQSEKNVSESDTGEEMDIKFKTMTPKCKLVYLNGEQIGEVNKGGDVTHTDWAKMKGNRHQDWAGDINIEGERLPIGRTEKISELKSKIARTIRSYYIRKQHAENQNAENNVSESDDYLPEK